MTNGTRPGLLLHELLAGDGPFGKLADRFVAAACSGCGISVAREAPSDDEGYWCIRCWPARDPRDQRGAA